YRCSSVQGRTDCLVSGSAPSRTSGLSRSHPFGRSLLPASGGVHPSDAEVGLRRSLLARIELDDVSSVRSRGQNAQCRLPPVESVSNVTPPPPGRGERSTFAPPFRRAPIPSGPGELLPQASRRKTPGPARLRTERCRVSRSYAS